MEKETVRTREDCIGVTHICLWVATVVNNGQNILKITTDVQKSHLNKDCRGFL